MRIKTEFTFPFEGITEMVLRVLTYLSSDSDSEVTVDLSSDWGITVDLSLNWGVTVALLFAESISA